MKVDKSVYVLLGIGVFTALTILLIVKLKNPAISERKFSSKKKPIIDFYTSF